MGVSTWLSLSLGLFVADSVDILDWLALELSQCIGALDRAMSECQA